MLPLARQEHEAEILAHRSTRAVDIGILNVKGHARIELVVVFGTHAGQPQRDVVAIRIQIEGVKHARRWQPFPGRSASMLCPVVHVLMEVTNVPVFV